MTMIEPNEDALQKAWSLLALLPADPQEAECVLLLTRILLETGAYCGEAVH